MDMGDWLRHFSAAQADSLIAANPFTENHKTRLRRYEQWLIVVRDTYISLLPIIVVGTLALSLSQAMKLLFLDQAGWGWLAGLQSFFDLISRTALGIMGLLASMVIAGKLSMQFSGRAYSSQTQLAVAGLAGAVFLIIVFFNKFIDFQGLGYSRFFQSVVAGIVTAELMSYLLSYRRNTHSLHELEQGASVGEAMSISICAFWTLMIIFVGISLLGLVLEQLRNLADFLLIPWLQHHLNSAYVLNPLLILINQMLWSVGINGGSFLKTIANSGYGLIAPLDVVFSEHQGSLVLLNTFGHLGGAGATWGLILCAIVRGRDQVVRRLAIFSIFPAIFNINEILLFGIPLIFGRTMWLSFLLAPLFASSFALLLNWLHWLPLNGVAVGWSMPDLFSGYAASGSWVGCWTQLAGVCISAVIYAPALARFEAQRRDAFHSNFKHVLVELEAQTMLAPQRILNRYDVVGAVAKRLLHDFRKDIGSPNVFMAFQPQHDGKGKLVGVEALLRWKHAEFGTIAPAVIVSLAEESGLIHRLGEWTLRDVARQRRRWRSEGLQFKVSVNVSPLQLENEKFPDMLQQILEIHDLDSKDLHLEITEAQKLSTSAVTESTLRRLQDMGIPLEIDDFGMGSTSLLYLMRFKVAVIKLDGVLTRLVQENKPEQDIISCICRLGREQGVKIVAEYVESAPQKKLLETLGCDMFQGWYFSSALKADELVQYVRSSAS